MDGVEEFAKATYGHQAMPDPALEDEKEEEKPEVTSRAGDDVSMTTQGVVEMSDERPQVTAMPVVHGNGGIAHNAAVQEAHEAEAMFEDEESAEDEPPEATTCIESGSTAGLGEIQELFRCWDTDEARRESSEHDFKRASEMAAQGDPVAMYKLSEIMEGAAFSTPTVQQKRFELLVAAANRGWVPAIQELGFYFRGHGDMNSAGNCYAAMQACWPAFQELAGKEGWLPFMTGEVGILDFGFNEYVWQSRLAREGSTSAMRQLAEVLLARSQDEATTQEAYRWLNAAAVAGDAKAMLALGMMLEHRIGVAQDRARALALYRQAAEKGLADAQMKLSSLYAQHQDSSEWRAAGLITDGKGTVSYEWCLRAVKHGSLQAKLQLAQMLATGNGVAKDVKAAFALCKEAADTGLDEARLPLAIMYVTGTGTERDEDEAMYYLQPRIGEYAGAYRLAMIHMGEDERIVDTARRFGIQLSINRKRAFVWFREAGWDMSKSELGARVKELMATGDGAFRDGEEAVDWFRYQDWQDERIDRNLKLEATMAPEMVRKLVERNIEIGAWKPSRGECINLSGMSYQLGVTWTHWTRYLPQALSKASRLRHLNIAANILMDDSAEDIATLIRETKTLEVLDLKFNEFTAAGHRTIAAAMRGNFTLRRVHTGARLNSEEYRLIRSLCRRNRNLQKLFAEFKSPSPLACMTVPTEISELLEQHLLLQDQKDGTQSANATRQRVLEMLMCLQPTVLHARPGAKTT